MGADRDFFTPSHQIELEVLHVIRSHRGAGRAFHEVVTQELPLGAYSEMLRRRRALAMTETELKVMAALAIIGLSNKPANG